MASPLQGGAPWRCIAGIANCMTEEKKSPEPTMEEILASIRRIISEDSQNASSGGDAGIAAAPENLAPLRAQRPAADPRPGTQAPAPAIPDSADYGPPAGPADIPADEDEIGGEPPYDLTDPLPGAASGTASPTPDRENDRILDLTDEVRDLAVPSADAGDVMDLHDALDAPSLAVTAGEPETGDPHSASLRDQIDTPLLTPRAEAAAADALNRLRDASERRHELASAALGDSNIEAMIEERIDSALAARLQPLLMQKIDAMLGSQIGPALNERLSETVNDRLGPLLVERLDPALRDGLNDELRRRVDPLLDERLPPALRERLDPALRERLDPLLRDWLERHLPDIVERAVEREIDRLSRRTGGS